MTIEIFHNPRCSKSRQALALLEERGVEARVVRYLDTPPDAQRLEQLLQLLRLEPRELMRKKEPEYKGLGLDDPQLTRAELIQAMVQHPQLIERPILVIDDRKAVIGRPPERILEIL